MAAQIANRTLRFEKWTYRDFILTAGQVAFKNALAVSDTTAATGTLLAGAEGPSMVLFGLFDEHVDASLGAKRVRVNFMTERTVYTEYENEDAGKGLKMRKQLLEDTDANGVELASEWSSDMGAQMAYWPQKKVAEAIRFGETAIGYDGVPYFHREHPVNPYAPEAGVYANLFTGPAIGIYPGACPIDSSVTVDTALENLGRCFPTFEASGCRTARTLEVFVRWGFSRSSKALPQAVSRPEDLLPIPSNHPTSGRRTSERTRRTFDEPCDPRRVDSEP